MTFAEYLVVPNAVWEFLNKSGQMISYASSHWTMARSPEGYSIDWYW